MRLNDMSLETYMQKNLWDPLGIKNITFHSKRKPDVYKHLVHLTRRGPTDDKVHWTEGKYQQDRNDVDDFGGGGAVGSATEYMKILQSICANDGKLLTSEMIDEMFTPQLNVDAQKAFCQFKPLFSDSNVSKSNELGTTLNWGLGGLLLLSDEEAGVKGGTLSWGGLPNLFWTIDRGKGMSLFYAGNLLPYGDCKSREMEELF